jgi:hypothetical protein
MLLLVPARIENSNTISSPEVVVNGTITIHCPAFGVPPPNINWYIDGTHLSSESYSNCIEITY